MKQRQYVVIMAGGGGTRLWPHSRRSRPKQFLPMLPGGESLLAATVRRTRAVVPIQNTLVVTTASQVPEVRRCLPELPVDNILVEPVGRNTAPCIGLAALTVERRDPAGVMAVLPSDHFVEDEAAFARLLGHALVIADRGYVVTLGVRPTHPETGYGYIQLDSPLVPPAIGQPPSPTDDWADSEYLAAAFVEKPTRERAVEYLASGSYLWNSGMFFFPARRILEELRHHLPALGRLLDELRHHPEHIAARYAEAPPISIDYAVMEKLGANTAGADAAIRVLVGDFGWNDVGSFAAVGALTQSDEQGNHVLGATRAPSPPILVDARDNIVWSSSGQVISAIGVEGLVIAVTEDAVLVLPQGRAQDVREIVTQLQRDGRGELL